MNCENCGDTENYYAKGLCRSCYDKKNYNKNRDKRLEDIKIWRKNNPEKVRAMKRRYYLKYRDEILIKVRNYWKTDKGKLVSNRKREKRRAIKKNTYETYTTENWLNRLQKTKGICPKCNTNVGIWKLEIDHVIPLSKAYPGQIYTLYDVQPLCKSCNCRKGNKIEGFEEWQKYLV